MSKTAERLLTFFIGIPVIVGCAALSWANHMMMHIAVLVTTILVSFELHGILSKSMKTQNKGFVIILSAVVPLVTSLQVLIGFSSDYVVLTLAAVCTLVFAVEIWGYDRTTHSFSDCGQRIASSLAIIVYSGFFMSFISRLGAFPQLSAFISLFLLLVFGCDSCAWLFGMTMGKNNRNVIIASPNKSVMGFIGGFVGAFIAVFVAQLIFPVLASYPFWKIAVVAVIISCTAIVGDLVESVLKRSSNTKDSGNIIPGRGGLLDSADSIIFSAPAYYLLVKLFLGM